MLSRDEYRALVDSAGLLERTERGRLRLTGADRRTYLQGLLTNDVAALTPGTGCYAALLTANGRMVTDMRVLELGDSILIDLPLSVTPAIRDRLDQFIFSEDVSVADVSELLAQAGLYGPGSAAVAAAALRSRSTPGDRLPDVNDLKHLKLFESVRVDGDAPVVVAASDDFGVQGFELFAGTAAKEALIHALVEAGAVPVSRETAEITRVEAARPLFGVDMDEETIPLEAGIEDRAVSHTKGCYVGQEIIIRVLHRGHGRVARRLVSLDVDGPVPSRGDRISAGDREIGAVTSAVHSPKSGHAVALGYVRREHAEPGTTVTVSGAHGAVQATVVKGTA